MLTVSFSSVRDWKSCRNLWYYRRVMNLTRRRKPLPLQRGSIIHDMLEAYLKTGKVKAIKKVYAVVKEEFDLLMDEEKEYYGDLPNECYQVIMRYIRHYEELDENLNTLGVELAFGDKEIPPVEIAPGLAVRGRIDWAFEAKDGPYPGIWISDHKTAKSMIPPEKSRLFDAQTVLYYRVAPLLGLPEPTGVMFNYIPMKPPTMPKLNKDGSVSKKKINTDLETLMQFFEDNNIDPDDYPDHVERASKTQFFERRYMAKPDAICDNIITELKIIAMEMEKLKNFPYRTNPNGLACKSCEFDQLCMAELMGLDTSFILKSEYKVKEVKTDDGEEDGEENLSEEESNTGDSE